MSQEKHYNDPDERDMRSLATGQQSALNHIMDRHLNAIHATAYRIMGDHMAAEDVAQLVFLKLWEMAPKWEFGRGTVKAYLYRMTHHRCLDQLRKKRDILPDELPEKIDPQKSADTLLSEQDTRHEIKTAMDQLSYNQRTALVLSYYQDLSLKEGAQAMDISPSAFESLLRRARKTLKTHLGHMQDEYILDIKAKGVSHGTS